MLWSTHQLCIIHRAPSQTGEEVMLSHMASCAGKVKRERERDFRVIHLLLREKRKRKRERKGRDERQHGG